MTATEPGPGGHAIGRDPRRMTQTELRAMGHVGLSPMQAIRAHCLDCCCGSSGEVRTAFRCPSWPFRMGANAWRTVSEGRREAGRRLAAARKNPKPDLSAGDGERCR